MNQDLNYFSQMDLRMATFISTIRVPVHIHLEY